MGLERPDGQVSRGSVLGLRSSMALTLSLRSKISGALCTSLSSHLGLYHARLYELP